MKNINFLPAEVLGQRQLQAQHWLSLGLIVACGLLMVSTALYQALLRAYTRSELARWEPLSRATKQLEEEQRTLERELLVWNHRASVYALIGARWPTTSLLGAIWEVFPQDAQLTQVVIRRTSIAEPRAATTSVIATSDNNTTSTDVAEEEFRQRWQKIQKERLAIELVGTTSNPTALLPFLDAVEKCPLFESAKLESLKRDAKGTDSRLNFTIRIQARPEWLASQQPVDGRAPAGPGSSDEAQTVTDSGPPGADNETDSAHVATSTWRTLRAPQAIKP